MGQTDPCNRGGLVATPPLLECKPCWPVRGKGTPWESTLGTWWALGVGYGHALMILFLKGVAGVKAVMVEALELPLWVVQSVSVVIVYNDANIREFLPSLELVIFWGEYQIMSQTWCPLMRRMNSLSINLQSTKPACW